MLLMVIMMLVGSKPSMMIHILRGGGCGGTISNDSSSILELNRNQVTHDDGI